MIRKIAVRDKNGVIRVDEIGGTTKLRVPIQAGTLTYNGTAQLPTWVGYDPEKMEIICPERTIAGIGFAFFTPKEGYTWEDGTTGSKMVNWTIQKAASLLGLSRPELRLEYGEDSKTVHVDKAGFGEIHFSYPIGSGLAIGQLNATGNTITLTRRGVNAVKSKLTITVDGDENHERGQAEVPVTIVGYRPVGVEWDGSSSTKWTRTDGAKDFADPVPYVAGATDYGSPFDDLMPWAGMKRVLRSGNGMVAIPKFYYKLTQSEGGGLKIQIGGEKLAGWSTSPAHMDRGDGGGERDVVYIGRYICGRNSFKSESKKEPERSTTRATARSNIHDLGADFWQSDFAMRFTLWLLYLVEFADWDSQSRIGHGCMGDEEVFVNTGHTDAMPYHTGTMQASREDYGVGIQYRNIEGLWSNMFEWCDGCYNDDSGLNIILDPAYFSDKSNGHGACVGLPVSGYPGAFTVSAAGGFPLFYSSGTGGGEGSFSCDVWSFSGASSPNVYVGGFEPRKERGLFCMGCTAMSTAGVNIGCRMMELPTESPVEPTE